MNRKALENQLRNKTFERVYLLFGEERFFLSYDEHRLVKAALGGADPVWNMSCFNRNAQPEAVFDACQMLPLGGQRRVVRVEDCPAFEKAEAKDAWVEVIKSVPETCLLLFISRTEVDGRFSATKAVGPNRMVKYEWFSEPDLIREIENSYLNRLVFKRNALHRLIYRAGNDAATISNEIKKIEAYVYPKKEITAEDVDAVSIVNESATAFDITDDLIDGKYERAFTRLHLYVRQGGLIMMLRGAIARRLRDLMTARLLIDGKKPASAVMAALTGPHFARERTLQTARRVPMETLERALRLLAEGAQLERSGLGGDDLTVFEYTLVQAFIKKERPGS
jgi:DNA polymerase-3 subunit delta